VKDTRHSFPNPGLLQRYSDLRTPTTWTLSIFAPKPGCALPGRKSHDLCVIAAFKHLSNNADFLHFGHATPIHLFKIIYPYRQLHPEAMNSTAMANEPEWSSKPAWKLPGWAEPLVSDSSWFAET